MKTCKRCNFSGNLSWQLDINSGKWKLFDNITERWHECKVLSKPKKEQKFVKCKNPFCNKAGEWIKIEDWKNHQAAHIDYWSHQNGLS